MSVLEQYRDSTWDITTSILAVIALIGVGYTWYYQPLRSDIEALQNSGTHIKKNIKQAELRLKEVQEESLDASSAIKTIPAFLTSINAIAHETKVYLDTVEPVEGNPFQYEIAFAAKYRTFIRFLLGLEALNVAIEDIAINPFEGPRDDPTQAISFKITLLGQEEQPDEKQIAVFREKVENPKNRNPFRMGLPGEGLPDTIDLTTRWKLSAFIRGSGGSPPSVYINGKRYSKGDHIGKKKITEIFFNSHVELEEKIYGYPQKYILKTRIKPKTVR